MQKIIHSRNSKLKFKLFIISIFSALVIQQCYGQKDIYLTFYGMPQRTYMYNSMEKNHADLSPYSYNASVKDIRKYPTYTMGVGLLFKHRIKGEFLFCYGFQYSPMHQKWAVFDTYRNAYVHGSVRLSYLKMPVLIQYNYLVRKKYQLSVSGGPQISMLLTEKGGLPAYGVNAVFFDLAETGGAYHEFTLDGVFATGGEMRLYKNTFVFLQVKVDYSFTNAEKKTVYELGNYGYNLFQYTNNKVRPRTHTISTSISLGLTFKIK
jgi:hypothetical protein